MSNVLQIGDLGFAAIMSHPTPETAPSLPDLYSLWGVYKTIAGSSDWKIGSSTVIKSASFRAEFKAFAKAVAALDALMDDPAKVAEAQQAAAGLLA